MLSLYNTLTRKVESFTALKPPTVGFYGCGPTVYNYAHIGNLRAYITHDILVRTLRRNGFSVKHVMNITDIGHLAGDSDDGDDKMLSSAEKAKKSVLEIAAFYTDAFFHDCALLGIEKPEIVCKATEHIDKMIALIEQLESGGFTYKSGGNVYFDVSKFPRYGDFARLVLDESAQRSRVDTDTNKKNAYDFALWFTKSKYEQHALTWDSPWGRGYPGWHIECSAMASAYLGTQFDIHAGGVDHIGVHHTNEIAQAEAGFGVHPWVRYWVHNEFLVLNKGKMSKSEGGFLTLQALLDKGFDALDYRYLLLGAHYRSQVQFSFEALEGARNARQSLLEKLAALKSAAAPSAAPAPQDNARLLSFNAALDDDLSTPRALSELWSLLKDKSVPSSEAFAVALLMDKALGLGLKEALEDGKASAKEAPVGINAQEIEALLKERDAAKKERNFARADEIRAILKEKGIAIEDTKDGTIWHLR